MSRGDDPAGPLAAMKRLRVVLVRPKEPGNVGSAARAMMNFGIGDMAIVPGETPARALLGGDAARLAGKAEGILRAARVALDVPTALEGMTCALGATARTRARIPALSVEELPAVASPLLAAGEGVALVFGPEDKGLSNEDLNHCQKVFTIPASPEHPSLNLAQAVLVFCYVASRSARRGLSIGAGPPSDPAPSEEREAMYDQMRRVLLDIGYLDPQAPEHIEGELRRLLDRARPTSREITLLRGIWSQVAWAWREGCE